MNKILKALLVSLVIIFGALASIGIINILAPSISLHLKVILILMFEMIIISPFIPRHKSKQSFFTKILSKYKNIANQSQNFKFQPKNLIELNDKYEQPIISKCKCGFILTSYTKNCPECGRENNLYKENPKKIY